MKELGEYLKRTRNSNGVSIAEAAEDLDLQAVILENLESGNVRAFKDMYELREAVKVYAKYLGLSPDKIVDEFNDFLFEHTSKISLDDIKMAQKNKEKKEENKIKSPYTKEYKEPKRIWPIIYIIMGLILLVIIIYLIISSQNKAPIRVDELKERMVNYEFTY